MLCMLHGPFTSDLRVVSTSSLRRRPSPRHAARRRQGLPSSVPEIAEGLTTDFDGGPTSIGSMIANVGWRNRDFSEWSIKLIFY